jgi:hypothetical protein
MKTRIANCIKLAEEKNFLYASALLMGLVLYWVIFLLGTSHFSPDSWAYYELSKTIFNENFYEFNTIRSYLGNTHSASFPFGYPIALALLQLLGLSEPIVASYFNLTVTILELFLIVKISKLHEIPSIFGFALACSALLNIYYLDEVIAGRSMPLAILCILSAYYFIKTERVFLSGLLLGLSALVRFDFLVHSILILVAIYSYSPIKPNKLRIISGYLLGLLPWVIYSIIHFKALWITDNSWVALSAVKAYVLDYPAAAVPTIFSDPVMWIVKILKNVLSTISVLILTSLAVPLFWSMIFFMYWRRNLLNVNLSFVWMGLLVIASIMPNLATGYRDRRYFLLLLLCISFVFVWKMMQLHGSELRQKVNTKFAIIPILYCKNE